MTLLCFPTTQSTSLTANPQVISKVLIKAVTKQTKESKTFTLRDVNTSIIDTTAKLKNIIKEQLQDEVVRVFDICYIQTASSNAVVTIRNKEDIAEVWRELLHGSKKIVLWCNGLKVSGKKRKKTSESSSTDDVETM